MSLNFALNFVNIWFVNFWRGYMNLYTRVIQVSEIDELMIFEMKKLAENVADEDERRMMSWNARWRKESLDHYIPMGWSFLARDKEMERIASLDGISSEEGLLAGYFIAQPLLFLDGQTQSLLIEHHS